MWQDILGFLAVEDIFGLYFTGSGVLHRRLGSEGGCDRLDNRHSPELPTLRHWPSTILSQLHGLQLLRILASPLRYINLPLHLTISDIAQLPRGLATLRLELPDGLTDAHLTALPAELTCLWLPFNKSITCVGLELMPRTLLVLNLVSNPCISDLSRAPPRLQSFVGNSDAIKSLEQVINTFPLSLVKIKLRGSPTKIPTWRWLHLTLFARFPRLEAVSVSPISGGNKIDHDIQLPTQLASLAVKSEPGAFCPSLRALPPGLTELSFIYSTSSRSPHDWNDLDIALLPRTLMKLRIEPEDSDSLIGNLTPAHFQYLPPNLLEYRVFTLIPSKLAFPEDWTSGYVAKFTSMNVFLQDYLADHMQQLPQTITTLSVQMCAYPHHTNIVTGPPAYSLPPNIRIAPGSKDHCPGRFTLPYHLQSLQLTSSWGTVLLPIPPAILAFGPDTKQDAAISSLGRDRSLLVLSCNPTDSSLLTNLPRALTFLRLRFEQRFDDTDLAHLPQGLKTLHLIFDRAVIESATAAAPNPPSGWDKIASATKELVSWLSSAPPATTKKQVSCTFGNRSIAFLPRSLRSLEVVNHTLNASEPVEWPPHLTSLVLTAPSKWQVGKEGAIPPLPKSLLTLHAVGDFHDNDFASDEALPRHLQSLSLPDAARLSSKICPCLSKLGSLTSLDVPGLSLIDAAVRLLPRTLKSFANNLRSDVTDASAGDWPPKMQVLQVPGHAFSILGLKLLPKSLTRLTLNSAELSEPEEALRHALGPEMAIVSLGRRQFVWRFD